MARTIRSESDANELQAARVIAIQARNYATADERADWRKVLAQRDIRRASVRNIDASIRRNRKQMGHARAALLAVVTMGATVVAFAIQLF